MNHNNHKIKANNLLSEITFLTSRSSGPGGQNVNKVNTKVTLQFNVPNSQFLSDEQKQIIIEKLASRINKDGVLAIAAQNKRSQLQNKEVTLMKLDKLFAKAFYVKKARKATKPKKSAIMIRLNEKKRHAEKKKYRQKPI
jgi:ribosome-associated protein